ncbi:craniofacial development protein 2-like protein [Plakobranchus ocellatus]|uniref:Craniofacial development protein 2-like protein n=1 Tax=Plakobranchus ocellatus TaxID=259542 RepID=A0AAV4DMY8_9GAST|nr:craniofacial development protein 2-like protein [Plakobranchus ocellatus]
MRTEKDNKHRNKIRSNKRATIIGIWNVQTMKEMGKLHLLINEMEHQDVYILGICECRWKDNGHFDYNGCKIIYSGGNGTLNGVAIILDKSMKNSLISYNAVSDRILIIHLDTNPVKTSIIQAYAPTTSHDDEEVEQFYNQLQSVKDSISPRNTTIVMGDFNAKVGEEDIHGYHQVIDAETKLTTY